MKDTRFYTERQQVFLDFKLFLISSFIHFLFFSVVTKFMNCFTSSTDFSYMLASRHAQHLIFGEKIINLGIGAGLFKPKSFKILHPFLNEYKLLKVRGSSE
jgi:hypothetical protein